MWYFFFYRNIFIKKYKINVSNRCMATIIVMNEGVRWLWVNKSSHERLIPPVTPHALRVPDVTTLLCLLLPLVTSASSFLLVFLLPYIYMSKRNKQGRHLAVARAAKKRKYEDISISNISNIIGGEGESDHALPRTNKPRDCYLWIYENKYFIFHLFIPKNKYKNRNDWKSILYITVKHKKRKKKQL